MFNIRIASQMTGIPPVTIRAWETRYHAVTPRRSQGGHRLYSQRDVEDLLWLKKQTEMYNLSISQAVQLLHKRKDNNSSAVAAEVLSEENLIVEELREQLYSLDSQRVHAILDRAFAMFPLSIVMQRIIMPFLVEVGERWMNGEITVAQEHYMSQLLSQRFWQVSRVFEVNPTLPKTLALCPSGEEHQIGLMMFCTFLRRQGVDVIFLGANTPLDGLDQLIDSLGVECVCVSISMQSSVESANRLIEKLAPIKRKLQFVIGGARSTDERLDERYIRVGNFEEDWKELFDRSWAKPQRRMGMEQRKTN